MKTITVRLPEAIAAELEAESRARGVSKSDVVRRRLERASPGVRRRPATATVYDLAADLIGSVEDSRLPKDLSACRKRYLRELGYGRKRRR